MKPKDVQCLKLEHRAWKRIHLCKALLKQNVGAKRIWLTHARHI